MIDPIAIKMLLDSANGIKILESLLMGIDDRQPFHYEGATLKWEEDIPPDLFKRMQEESECAILLDEAGKPKYFLLVRKAWADNEKGYEYQMLQKDMPVKMMQLVRESRDLTERDHLNEAHAKLRVQGSRAINAGFGDEVRAALNQEEMAQLAHELHELTGAAKLHFKGHTFYAVIIAEKQTLDIGTAKDFETIYPGLVEMLDAGANGQTQ